ncbi:hypothetical protein MRB53_018648 [Persea americana]|uniref:Uncharacterized protein n=1 Tax=Persea americana TaxID=3435 RepID=A0ACC2M9F9_PERAE|nr:hypothetical protein MRB53_018648 [Persea americana]
MQENSVGAQVTKVVGDAGADVDINPTSATVYVQNREGEIATDGVLHQTTKERKKEKEATLDGELIVERKSFDAEENSNTEEAAAKHDSPSVIEFQLMAEVRSKDADRELTGYSEKISELTPMLRGAEEDSTQLKRRLKEYEEKIAHLESAVNLSSIWSLELEQALKVVKKCAENVGYASKAHQHSLELEHLMQGSQSKEDNLEKVVGKMELLLESSNHMLRQRELEEQISILEKRCGDVEAELKHYSDRVAELTVELETLQVNLPSLEIALEAASEREQELMASLNIASEECKKYEDAAKSSNEKLLKTENLMEVLRNELKLAQSKLESIEDFMVSITSESEVMEKLKSAEQQLEKQRRMIEQATARNSELELLHESFAKSSELLLRKANQRCKDRDSDLKYLHKVLTEYEDNVRIYQIFINESVIIEESLRYELAESSIKLVSHGKTLEELKSKVLEAETRAQLLAETNLKLKKELKN